MNSVEITNVKSCQKDTHTWLVEIEIKDGEVFAYSAATGFTEQEALERARKLVWEHYQSQIEHELTMSRN